MPDKAWTALESFGNSILLRETNTPDLVLLKTLANGFIDDISDVVRVYRSWDNATGNAEVTLTSNTFPMPSDMTKLTGVWWDGAELTETDEAWLDACSDDWRTRTGIPSSFVKVGRSIILDAVPEGSTAGKLVVWGYGPIPYFGTSTAADAPFPYIPIPFQMLPVEYALERYPADPQSAMSTARKADYGRRVAEQMPRFLSAMKAQSSEVFTF
jgi:hypothetical protein